MNKRKKPTRMLKKRICFPLDTQSNAHGWWKVIICINKRTTTTITLGNRNDGDSSTRFSFPNKWIFNSNSEYHFISVESEKTSRACFVHIFILVDVSCLAASLILTKLQPCNPLNWLWHIHSFIHFSLSCFLVWFVFVLFRFLFACSRTVLVVVIPFCCKNTLTRSHLHRKSAAITHGATFLFLFVRVWVLFFLLLEKFIWIYGSLLFSRLVHLYLPLGWIGGYGGGGFIHVPSGLRMCRRSDENSVRYCSAGITRKNLLASIYFTEYIKSRWMHDKQMKYETQNKYENNFMFYPW